MKKLLTVLLTVMLAFTTFGMNVLAEEEPLGASPKPQKIDNLVYNGEPQALVTAGIPGENQKYQYRLGSSGPWGDDIPSGTDAKLDYKVQYKMVWTNKEEGKHSGGHEIGDDVSFSFGEIKNIPIAKKPIEITADDKTMTVGGDVPEFTATVVGDTVTGQTLTYDVECNGEKTVGKHEIKITNAKVVDAESKDVTKNYNITTKKGELTVEKVRIALTFEVVLPEGGFVYDGSPKIPSVKFYDANGTEVSLTKDVGDREKDKRDYGLKYDNNTNASNDVAGKAKAIVTLHNDDYKLEVTEKEFEIAKATWKGPKDYDDGHGQVIKGVEQYESATYADSANAKIVVNNIEFNVNPLWATYEYKLKSADDSAWATITDTHGAGPAKRPAVKNLLPGTYVVRAKADDNHNASEVYEIVVTSRQPLEVENASHEYKTEKDAQIWCKYLDTELVSVVVDGVTLTKNVDYTVESGSTIVNFDKDYLNTLSVGKHPVELNYRSGIVTTTVDAEINVYKKDPAPKKDTFVAPKTGVR